MDALALQARRWIAVFTFCTSSGGLLGRYAAELSDVVALRACSVGLARARVDARDGVAS